MELKDESIGLIKEFHEPLLDQNNVLDLGCGNTALTLDICNEFEWIDKIIAVDDDRDKRVKNFFLKDIHKVSEDYQDTIKGRFTIKTMNCDLNKITLIPQSIEEYIASVVSNFEFIILSNVLHFYIQKNDRLSLLRKINKILVENGCVYVRIASEEHRVYSEKGNAITFDYSQILEEVSMTNFTFKCLPRKVINKESWHFLLKK